MIGALGLSLAGCGGSVSPAPRPTLTVTAADASRIYGAANPVFTASASGALSGDTFTLTATTVATPSSAVGTYSIVPAATGVNLASYNVVYVNGTLTVGKATLTVTPNNQSVVSEAAFPSFTATITGFVNGDTSTVVTGLPAITTTAISSSPVGSYPITAALGILAASNYTFTFGTGTLTIVPASIPGPGFTGRAMAGNQPVLGAAVQVYAAGTGGNGSAGTALLSSTLTTDANGAFTVPAGYACPAAASQLYVIIRGGQVKTDANPAIALATPIGACNASSLPPRRSSSTRSPPQLPAGACPSSSAPGGNIGATATNTQGWPTPSPPLRTSPTSPPAPRPEPISPKTAPRPPQRSTPSPMR